MNTSTHEQRNPAATEQPPSNGLEVVVDGLYATGPHRLPFGRELNARAFVLVREPGNLLVHGAGALEPHVEEVAALGGLARQYINHSHEASPAVDRVAERFGAPLFVHADDSDEVAAIASAGSTFTERHHLDDDFEVIPVPGHTPGATVYLWDTGEHRVLFTGDTLFLGESGWRAAVLDGISDRERYLEALALLRTLDFDVLAPGIAQGDRPSHEHVRPEAAGERIEAVIDRLRAGQDN